MKDLEHLPIPLSLVESSGEIRYSNLSWSDLTIAIKNRGPGDSTGEAIDQAFNFSRPYWHHQIQRCLSLGQIEIVDKDNRLYWKLSPTHRQESATAVWISCSDLETMATVVSTYRTENFQLAKLKELSEMAAGIAHEITNPLTVIYAKAHYLKEKMKDVDSLQREVLEEPIAKICAHSERIYKVVSGMRSFSRDSVNDPMFPTKVVNLINESMALVMGTVRDMGVEVAMAKIDSSLEIDCRCSQLMQVVINILNNAIYAVKDRPFPQIKVQVQENKNEVRLLFSDNGDGISIEDEQKIFNPFFSTKPAGSGTGLGLSISRKIVQDHGGSLSLDRSISASCFAISLPRKSGPR